MNMKLPKCEVCGRPANITIQDVYVSDNWDTGVKEMSPAGVPHHFCDEHKRDSEFIDITESPLTHFYRKEAEKKK